VSSAFCSTPEGLVLLLGSILQRCDLLLLSNGC
jgi:hypothetical protein